MTVSLRRLARDVAVYSFGDILVKASAFLTMPVYTRVFTPDDYGVWNYIAALVGFLGGVVVLGGDSAYARYFFELKTREERRTLTSTWMGFLLVWSLAITAIAVVFSNSIAVWSFGDDAHAILVAIALTGVPVAMVSSFCGQALRNDFRPGLFTATNVLTAASGIGLSLLAVLVYDLGILGVLAASVVGTAMWLPVRLWLIRHYLGWSFSGDLLRKLLAYGVPLVPTTVAYWIFGASDRIVLGQLSTFDQVGLYGVAASVTSILAFVNGAIGQAWTPHAIHAFEADRKSALVLFGRVATYLVATFGFLCVAVSAFAPELLRVLATPSFYAAAHAIGPLSLGYLAYASTQVTGIGISLAKRTGFFALYAWFAAALNLALNFLVVPRWGMVGAAWASALAYAFLTTAYAATSQRLLPVVHQARRTLVLVALVVGFTIGAAALPTLALPLAFAVKSAYCAAFAVLAYIGLGRPPLPWPSRRGAGVAASGVTRAEPAQARTGG